MDTLETLKRLVRSVSPNTFEQTALRVFRFQATNNPIYNSYIQLLKLDVDRIDSLEKIPFLPIEFFKYHDIKTCGWDVEDYFLSSGTTSMDKSKHLIESNSYYLNHAKETFEDIFGDLSEILLLALLPSYQGQGRSSLIKMVDSFMTYSLSDGTGYFLRNHVELENKILGAIGSKKKVVLFGVGYALLEFCEAVRGKFSGLIIIETGGMKGRREELTKEQFYALLKERLGNVSIYSEYGMTELLSQAYADENAVYSCSKYMKVLTRDINDPFANVSCNHAGGLNVIDLLNLHSCSFIETKDLGKLNDNEGFEILGRIDNSDLRGCNLMML